MNVSIIGTGHTEFGKLKDRDIYDLIKEAGKEALEDSQVEPDLIGGIWIGNYSGGSFNNQEHLGPYTLEIHPDLRFTPAVRVENACASGSAAISEASNALKAGEIDFALVVGAEKMNTLDTKGVMKALAKASYWPNEGEKGMTFPGLFAEFAKGYQKYYNYDLEKLREVFAKISAKNHRNATKNPLAQMPWDCDYEDILALDNDKNPVIAPPLRLYDCSLVTDGAAAVVLTTADRAREREKSVEILSLSSVTDYLALEKRSKHEFTAGKRAVNKAYKEAGISVEDLDFVEVHDCFTIAELLAYETIGLIDDGKGEEAINNGWTEADGKLPVNLSGGLKAKGHPVGATGISMAVLCARQLLDESIGIDLPNAEIGASFNIGGSAASNYFFVYKRQK